MLGIDFDAINEAFLAFSCVPPDLLMLLKSLPSGIQAAAYPSIASNDHKS